MQPIHNAIIILILSLQLVNLTNFLSNSCYANSAHGTKDLYLPVPLGIQLKQWNSLAINATDRNARKLPYSNTKKRNQRRAAIIILLLLLMSGDIESNPGPRHRHSSIFPCGVCQRHVDWSARALACDNCDVWFHATCIDLDSDNFKSLAAQDASWACFKCHSQNFTTNIFHSYEIPMQNRYSTLSDSSTSLPIPSPTFVPPMCSSPKNSLCNQIKNHHRCSPPNISAIDPLGSHLLRPQPTSPSASLHQSSYSQHEICEKKQNWRTLVVNVNSASGKTAEITNLIDATDPDAIILTETKLDGTIKNTEFLPPTFTTYRKDRSRHGGGVAIAIRSCFHTEAIELDSQSESVWATCNLRGGRKVLLGSYYRPPEKGIESIDNLESVLVQIERKIKNNPNAIVVLGGDFNAGDIDWCSGKIHLHSKKRKLHERLLDALRNANLTQLQMEPTRGENTLDLFCTNKPGLTKSISTIPGISDHEIIVADSNFNPVHNKKRPYKIYQYNKADWTKIRQSTIKFAEEYLSKQDENDIDTNWNKFKKHILNTMEQLIPSRLVSQKFAVPWINTEIKRMGKKKQRLYNKWKRTGRPEDREAFKSAKKEANKIIRKAHWDYVNKALIDGLNEKNSKPFWKYIKAKKLENFGIAPLKKDNTLHCSAAQKAKLLNDQFYSVFTKDRGEPIPDISGSKYPQIEPLTIREAGVLKLLNEIDPKKASGPDNIPCRMLKILAAEISPVLCQLFNQSIKQGHVPQEWKEAKVTPVFKKGNVHLPENYRPVSLTCVCSKLLERIVCGHIRAHLDKHKILSTVQHGFRARHSCETQLLTTIQDLASSWDRKEQIDVAVLDFAKAFDTVPHRKLLFKLGHYGITNNIHSWIESFLTGRVQRVVVDGVASDSVQVESGVPQGTVLGPLLFLVHINDLPDVVSSKVRLFADDCLLYRTITSPVDQIAFQTDLDRLVEWAGKWGMRFNTSKCNILRLSRSRKPHSRMYSLSDEILQLVDDTKYLGVNINKELSWSPHVENVAHKTTNTLAFLRRNLQQCPARLKEQAYASLVRSVLEYAAPIWDPYKVGDIATLEKVQRSAARFVKNDHRHQSSVTKMIRELGWPSLAERRRDQRLILLYKIVNDLVDVPTSEILSPADNRTRALHNKKFKHLPSNTPVYRQSFFGRTIPDWNDCPFVEVPTIDNFKSLVQRRFLH